jgi:hypothetical protein
MSAAAGMVLVAFGALAMLAAGALLVRRARRTPSAARIVASAAVVGAAAFLVVLLLSGLRHFGGEVRLTDGSSTHACAQWWMQIDSANGVGDVQPAPPDCRQLALDAVDPTLRQSGFIAAAWTALVAGYLAVRRRTVREAAAVSAAG